MKKKKQHKRDMNIVAHIKREISLATRKIGGKLKYQKKEKFKKYFDFDDFE